MTAQTQPFGAALHDFGPAGLASAMPKGDGFGANYAIRPFMLVPFGSKCYRPGVEPMDAAVSYIKHVLFAGYTRGEIGAAINYSTSGVSKAFHRGPSVEFLLRCALATGTPPAKLFDLAGKHDLAQRFSSAFPAEGEKKQDPLLARASLLLGKGFGRRLEERLKATEERLARFEAGFASLAESTGAEAGFAAVRGRVAALWRLAAEEAQPVLQEHPEGWQRCGGEPYCVFLKKPQRFEEAQISLLLEILRDIA